MGRKTWKSIPAKFRPLKNRLNIVMTKSVPDSFLDGSVYYVNSIQNVITIVNDRMRDFDKVWIIGGAQIYNQFLQKYPDHLEEIVLTRIDNHYECDAFVPLDFTGMTLIEDDPHTYNNINYRFMTYTV